MKTYVVCIDGTGNSVSQTDRDPAQRDIESVTETNVLRMFRFLTGVLHRDMRNQPQTMRPLMPQFPSGGDVDLGTALYLPGVGTSGNFLTSSWQGATGAGTLDRILLAYRFLAENYEPGDRIFGFGFSRGAFAVRSLAGLIELVGLPIQRRTLRADELGEARRAYEEKKKSLILQKSFRPVEIDFLGVWDTVGALAFENRQGDFHNLSPESVRYVAHALALDEQRRVFEPEYWKAQGVRTHVEEVWFAGVHSNVGGGYANEELANIALAWMVSKAVEAGLPTQPSYIDGWYRENSFGAARNSHQEFLEHLRILGRLVKGSPSPRVIQDNANVHASVFDRIEEAISDYSTGNLGKPAAWQTYGPAARFANAKPLPNKRTEFKGRIIETPDYLSGAVQLL